MRPFSTALAFAVSLLLLAGTVLAAPPPPPPPHGHGLRPDGPPPERRNRPATPFAIPAGPMTLDEAVRKVQRRTDGRILDARTVERDGRTIYRIKVLTNDNRVRVLRFDASGGASEEE